jgi:hypothetical protein
MAGSSPAMTLLMIVITGLDPVISKSSIRGMKDL